MKLAPEELHSKEFDRLKIPEAARALGSVEKTHVEVRGLCLRCSKKRST